MACAAPALNPLIAPRNSRSRWGSAYNAPKKSVCAAAVSLEGQNLTVEFRAFGQHVDLIPQYAAELVNARVDVVTASGDETVRAVRRRKPFRSLRSEAICSGPAS
jgi:hypothetical protein